MFQAIDMHTYLQVYRVLRALDYIIDIRCRSLDVTVISTLQRLTLDNAATVQGHAFTVGEERKRAAHAEACHAVGVSFVPVQL